MHDDHDSTDRYYDDHVPNPKRDRRRNPQYDWRQEPVLKAGWVFVVDYLSFPDMPEAKLPRIHLAGAMSGYVVMSRDDLWESIASAIEPCADTAESMLVKTGADSLSMRQFIIWLIDTGRVDLAQAEKWITEWLGDESQ